MLSELIIIPLALVRGCLNEFVVCCINCAAIAKPGLIMKKLLLLLPLVLVACDMQPSVSEKMFIGNHELRKMLTTKGIKGSAVLSGFFVLGTGSINGDSRTSTDLFVTFSWKGNDGTYMVSTLPVSKFRFAFDDTVSKPTVKFRWRPCYENCDDDKDALIEYVVLTCRSQDWPRDVVLPLNKRPDADDDDGRY